MSMTVRLSARTERAVNALARRRRQTRSDVVRDALELGSSWRGQKALRSRVETGALTLAPIDEGDAPRMRELMEKYRDLPMDLADASLVRVAEREDLTRIFTLDRRHFSVYRPGRRRRFAILPD
jgi:predicted nucleic acid-binding protein